MLFNSYVFILFFLPVFLVAFHWTRKMANKDLRYRDVCKWLIVIASLVFYAPFGWKNLAVLAVSVAINAVIGRGLIVRKDSAQNSKILMGLGVVINVAALLFFKFSGLFFPVAVSFYTFSQISFVVDAYRGEIGEFSLVDYLCFVLFFPKLLQGPLMGYGDFMEMLNGAVKAGLTNLPKEPSPWQIANLPKEPSPWQVVLRGMLLFSIGLFKKVILADTFGKAVNFGYENVAGLGSLEAILVAVFYSFQLYFDFSGYCDMASAVCMMMGFELPMNFNSPYKAVSITDFWKRWHITLTKFFTKYIYIPLGGNRKGRARLYLNLMIVFLVSGLWHGNGWTFIVWGAMHGVLYVIERFARDASTTERKSPAGLCRQVAQTILTFAYVTIAWVFFRADTIKDAITLITRMFIGGSKRLATQLSASFQLDEIWYVLKVTPLSKLSFSWDLCLWLFLIAAVVIIFFCQNAITITRNCKIGVKTTAATAILMIWSIISLAGVSTFLYMNF